MDAVELTVVLCKKWEGFRSKPYLCPAGVPTIGYGSTYYDDGTIVTLRDAPISREYAAALLEHEVRKTYLPAVLRQCPMVTNQWKLAALADFTYNLGEGNLRNSTLRRRVNAGDWKDVPTQLRKWVRGGGKVLKGLVNRREDEITYVEMDQKLV